ncbi:MAG: hypothetical protein PHI68_03335, partial [Candidatus Cloacimonetes bacterium]|nr:hypothetical protein [Candidatus Cloacimonadota bacterium]
MKNCIKYMCLMLICALLFTSAYAVSYEHYPLGVYSYLCDQYYDEDEIEQSISLIKDMGYNIVQITNQNSNNPLGNILAMLQSDNLHAIVADLDYPVSNPTNYNNYNTTALTTSSYLKFEAEFSGSDDIDFGNEDMNWYCSHDESYETEEEQTTIPRVGFSEHVPNSNDAYWRCNRTNTDCGYAYTDIRWRWLHIGLAENKRLGDEFWIYHDRRGEGDTPSSNQSRYLYIRFKLRMDNFAPSISGTTQLLSFTTKGETANGTAFVNHCCDYDPACSDTTTFHYDDFLALGSPMGYFDIEIKISYADLLSLNLISAVREFRYVLENLNPWVYWHGNCDLYLDYIEYEDQMHYDMMNDVTGYTTNINNRIDYLQSLNGNDIIKHMYSRCEPKLGQFHSYDRVHTYIANSGVPIPNPNIITAAYDTDHRKIPMPSGKYYDHVRCFMDSVKPEIILPDIYPVKSSIVYNSDDTNDHYALQTRIDNQLIYQYKQTRLKCNERTPRTTFIPIVQTFGEWKDNQWV